MIAMAVHGGAGAWRPEHLQAAPEGVQRAVAAGHAILAAGGDALDAMPHAVRIGDHPATTHV